MSIKIKVSYQNDAELERVLQLLHTDIKCIGKEHKTGQYKRRYIELIGNSEVDKCSSL